MTSDCKLWQKIFIDFRLDKNVMKRYNVNSTSFLRAMGTYMETSPVLRPCLCKS